MMKRIVLFLGLLLIGQFALAQVGIGNPESVTNDRSLQILNSLFPGLGTFGSLGSTAADGFSGAVAIFNGYVLFIGGILVAYTIFAGTINTAHDGEALGRKFSTAWLPIRTAGGTALILPIINGYCIMQFIVGFLIAQGIALTNNVWSAYMGASNNGANLIQVASAGMRTSQANINAKDLGVRVFSSLYCVQAGNAILNNVRSNPESPEYASLPASVRDTLQFVVHPPIQSGDNYVYAFGVSEQGALGFTKDSCGSLIIPSSKMDASKFALSPNTVGQSKWASMSGIGTISPEIMNGLQEQNRNATIRMISEMSSVASLAVQTTTNAIQQGSTRGDESIYSGVSATIDKIITDYENNLRNNAARVIIENSGLFDKFVQNSVADGWIMAGAFYPKMAFLTESVAMASNNMGVASDIKLPKNLFDESFQKYLLFANDLKNTLKSAPKNGSGLHDAANNDQGLFGFVKNIIISGGPMVVDPNAHPIMAMKRLGGWILGAAGGLVGLLFAKGLLLSFLSGPAGTFLVVLILPMIGVGFTLAYILPLMPFFIWFGALIGFLIMCVQAIIAAPLWAVMHLSPSGDDLTGSGSNGYRLVLSLLLRPVLMLFGLIASMQLLNVLGKFFTEIFFDIFALSQQDTGLFMSLLSIIIVPLLYAGGMYLLIKQLFQIIHVIPDQLLEWFGGGGGQLGQYAQEAANERGAMYAAVGVLGAKAADGVQNARQISLQKERNNLEKEERDRGLDAQMGPGAASLVQKMSGNSTGVLGAFQNSGASQRSVAQASASLSSAQAMVGGPGSSGATALMAKMDTFVEKNPDASPQEILKELNSNVNEHLKGELGDDVANLITNTAGGADHFSASPQANDLMNAIKETDRSLNQMRVDPEEIKQIQNSVAKDLLQSKQENPGQAFRDGVNRIVNEKQVDRDPIAPNPMDKAD